MQKSDGQWTRAKGFDSFCPLGPWIETDLGRPRPGPGRPRGQLHVDGERRQQGRTSQLIFVIPTLISYISQVMTLLPGDVVLTGTPSGVGPIRPGQKVDVTIEGLGTLSNTVERGRCRLHRRRRPMSRSAPVLPVPDGHGARRADADGAVQLGARAAHRRHFVFRIEDTDAARDSEESYRHIWTRCAGWAWTGTRARRSAARTVRTGSPSGPTSTARWRRSSWPPATPTSRSRPTRRSTPGGGRPGRTPSSATTTTTAFLTDAQKAAFRAEGRDRCCG